MISALTIAPGKISLVERDFPPIGSDEIFVAVKAAGICGSDIAIHRSPFPGRLSLPRVLGHEWSGEIIKIGRDVKNFKVGDRIVSEEIFWCGRCVECRKGFFDFCSNAIELGFTIDGAHSTHLVLPAYYCHRLPEEISFETGALIEPLSVAYNGLNLAGGGIAAGQKILVIGLGPIGLSAALWAHAGGATVIGIDRNKCRIEQAQKFNFSNLFCLNPTKGRRHLPAVLESGIDVIVEAAGSHDTIPPLLDSISPRGRIIVLGHYSKEINILFETIVLRGISIIGNCGQVGHNTYGYVIEALKNILFDPTPMITHKVSLNEVNDIFNFVLASEQYGKIQFII
ncbi:MAG: alcohol dehydrogenase catalytic domain-containing protein [Desulfobacterales bacterium]|nr:alcohol dehydrogenase catalytic domain-containing protein [Desulfobacterales bacterium]